MWFPVFAVICMLRNDANQEVVLYYSISWKSVLSENSCLGIRLCYCLLVSVLYFFQFLECGIIFYTKVKSPLWSVFPSSLSVNIKWLIRRLNQILVVASGEILLHKRIDARCYFRCLTRVSDLTSTCHFWRVWDSHESCVSSARPGCGITIDVYGWGTDPYQSYHMFMPE